jgi:hypothetical protein
LIQLRAGVLSWTLAAFVGVSAVRRHEHNMSVTHAALRNDVFGECFHFGTGAFLETAVMVEVDVERRLGKAVVVMEVLGQPLRKLACR